MSSRIDPENNGILPHEDSEGPQLSQQTGNTCLGGPNPAISEPDNKQTDNSSIQDVTPSTRINHKPLEFVTVSLAKENDSKGTSKIVRTQVMKDYFWKQRNPESLEQTPADQSRIPSQYKSRFRINAQPTKPKRKPVSRKTKGHDKSSSDAARAQKTRIVMLRGPITDLSIYDPDGFFASTPVGLLGGSLDPFNSFALQLKPESLKLIYYYKQSYSRDFLDLNVGGGYCLFDAREHRALFHSILYLVALDFNLRRGFRDDLGCLYHSSEAFRLINEQIQNGVIEDATVAAVALIAAKENLAGMFDVSHMHMQGLKCMVEKRGGIEMIQGIHRGVVMWADLCNSTVWNCPPQFPYISFSTSLEDPAFPPDTVASTENSSSQAHLGVEQQLISIMQSLREISVAKDVSAHKNKPGRVYDVEYKLHMLQARLSDDPFAPNEVAPLCVALNVYLYLAIRELPPRAQMIQRLIDRLQAWFKAASMERTTSLDQRKQNCILWMLFVGYGATMETGRQEWFAEALKSAYAEARYREMDQLHNTLRDVLWQDSWCEHYFKRLRAEHDDAIQS
ncbi:hypothetical protein J3F83DRAFT_751282 [Trichoderma novae-zelandiae]